MQNRRSVGSRGEQMAAEFLNRNGYEIIARNFRFERAEIDLIAKKGNLVVFCEVKTRKSNAFGSGEDSVDLKKQSQIRKAAEGYISVNGFDQLEFRFDVVVVEMKGKTTLIRSIENAF